ncbi:MAG: mechanosensitive ion channel family protein [Gemmatimonadota bacterium]
MTRMPDPRTWRSVRFALVCTLPITAMGCGYLGFGEDADGEVQADSAVVADSTLVAAQPPTIAPDSGAITPILDADSSVQVGPPVVLDSGAVAEVAEGPEPATSVEDAAPQSLEDRLDQILAGQEALNQRIDSIAAVGAGADVGTDSTGVGSGTQIIGDARARVQNFGVGVFWSIVVAFLISMTVRGSVWLLDALAESNASRRLFYKRLVPITRIILWAFAAYLIVSVIFRVDAQRLLAATAAIGVAIGFAAQDLLKNLFGGIILVFDQPFQVGDKISVGGTYGEVVSIGLRSTRIVTPDDNLVSVPNAQVVDQQVANANAGELNCQVVTDLYLPGWADEVLAKKIAFQAAASSKYVYLNKPIVTLVADVFKETFLTRVRVKAYVLDPRLEFAFQSDVTERAREGFREAGLLEAGHIEQRFLDHAAPAVLRRAQENGGGRVVTATSDPDPDSPTTGEGGADGG